MTQSKLPSFLLTTWLLGTIATKSRIGDFLDSLQEYEIVYPRVIENARNIRSTTHQEENNQLLEEPLFIEISNWTLRTMRNNRLLFSSNFTVEWIYSRGKKSLTSDINLECNLRQGNLEEGLNSLVVVTLCRDEVYALMMIDRQTFLVQPLSDGRHVMYESKRGGWQINQVPEKGKPIERKRSERAIYNTQGYYNLSGDVLDTEYSEAEKLVFYDDKEDDVETEEYSTEVDSGDIEHFSNSNWQRNKSFKKKKVGKESPSPLWLELGIAADYSVVNFHGTRVQEYVLALLNIVSAIYMDSSLRSNMFLVIARMILYAEKRDGMVRRGDARRSLENVNKWNRKMLSHSDVNHDVAVWLTRLDIGGPSGYAPVSGACDPGRSCALNRDEGLTSAFIIAHEVAHILGLNHDGDQSTGNACGDEASGGSVMAPMVAATFHHFYWSPCSRKEFHRRVRRWSCLLNRPKNDDGSTHLGFAVSKTFSMDEQCRMEFGEGYKLCETVHVPEPCSLLWCGNINISRSCKTKKGPPLDGTYCGESKWCMNGQCQVMDWKNYETRVASDKSRNGSKDSLTDGDWSEWGQWDKCSRSCGVGMKCRSRKCNKPPPTNGGKYCSGPNTDCKLCDLPKCSTLVDLRAQQCTKLDTLPYHRRTRLNTNITWLPYESDQESLQCQLICRSKETGEIFYTRTNLVGGTPCAYGSTNVCIQGECHEMGCDNILGSKKVPDVCGVCDGDDSNCENLISKFQRKLRREVTRVAVIPRKVYNLFLNVRIIESPVAYQDNLMIVVGDGRRRQNVEDNLPFQKTEKTKLLIVQGAAFRILQITNDTYNVRANGTTFEDVAILLVIPKSVVKEGGMTVEISLKYWLNREERKAKGRYTWLFGGWGFCSTSCGSGTRQKMILCKDEKTGRVVSRRKCPLTTKPAQETEKCNNYSCSFKWLPGPWEGCSSKCGNSGFETRQLYCIHSGFNGTELTKSNELEAYQIMVRASNCNHKTKPASSRECNRISCPGYWIFTDWSPIREYSEFN